MLKKPQNYFTYKIKYHMYNQLSIKNIYIYTFIPQKRISFSKNVFDRMSRLPIMKKIKELSECNVVISGVRDCKDENLALKLNSVFKKDLEYTEMHE